MRDALCYCVRRVVRVPVASRTAEASLWAGKSSISAEFHE